MPHTCTIMLLSVFFTTLLCGSSHAQSIHLSIGTKTLTAEIASTQKEMIIGLRNKTTLPENEGMIFIFPKKDIYCMTMKNTTIPLSIAFLNGNMDIIEIINMKPLSTGNYCVSQPANYAIEATVNWFNDVPLNTQVEFIQ